MSKKLRKVRLTSTNGEIHFIYEERCLSEWLIEELDCDEFEAKRVSKLEAFKPLLLVRE